MSRGDVEEGELVRTGGVIGDRRLDGIAGIAQINEVDALDDTSVLDVEAGITRTLNIVISPRPRARCGSG